MEGYGQITGHTNNVGVTGKGVEIEGEINRKSAFWDGHSFIR